MLCWRARGKVGGACKHCVAMVSLPLPPPHVALQSYEQAEVEGMAALLQVGYRMLR